MISREKQKISETPKNAPVSERMACECMGVRPPCLLTAQKSTTDGSTSIRFGNVASPEGDMAPSISTDFGENHGRGRRVSKMDPFNLSHLM